MSSLNFSPLSIYDLNNFHISSYLWLLISCMHDWLSLSGTNVSNAGSVLYAGMICEFIRISITQRANISVQLANKCFDAESIFKNISKNSIQKLNYNFLQSPLIFKIYFNYAKLTFTLPLWCLFNFRDKVSVSKWLLVSSVCFFTHTNLALFI